MPRENVARGKAPTETSVSSEPGAVVVTDGAEIARGITSIAESVGSSARPLDDLMLSTPSATVTFGTVRTVAVAGPPAAVQMSKFCTSGGGPTVSRMSRLNTRLPKHGESAGVLP